MPGRLRIEGSLLGIAECVGGREWVEDSRAEGKGRGQEEKRADSNSGSAFVVSFGPATGLNARARPGLSYSVGTVRDAAAVPVRLTGTLLGPIRVSAQYSPWAAASTSPTPVRALAIWILESGGRFRSLAVCCSVLGRALAA